MKVTSTTGRNLPSCCPCDEGQFNPELFLAVTQSQFLISWLSNLNSAQDRSWHELTALWEGGDAQRILSSLFLTQQVCFLHGGFI